MTEIIQHRFSTSGVEEARHSMSTLYRAEMDLSVRGAAPFRYDMSALTAEGLTLSRIVLAGSGSVGAAAFEDFVLVQIPRGQQQWAVGQEKGLGCVPFLILPQRQLHVRFADIEMLSVSLRRDVTLAAMRALTGSDRLDPNRESVNELRRDPRSLISTMRYVDHTFRSDPSALSEPLLRAELVRLLVATLISTLSLVDPPEPGALGQAVGPSALRRAMTFMDDNADQPVTISDVAAAAHMSVRALQVAFKTGVGRSPTRYLRDVRLNAAHADLLRHAASERTVEQVARRWGFAHTARFAALYRSTYGEYPSQTLRR